MANKRFSIKEYSAFAACFLITQKESSAEAIYTDISPDTLIDQELETFAIDLNNDGLIDFAFLRRSFSFLKTTYSSDYITSHFSALLVGPEQFGNQIAGTMNTISPSYGATTNYYPYAIPFNEMIDENMDFQYDGYQFLAFGFRGEYSSYWPFGGRWYPEISDRYLGFYFKDTANCFHYGWMRCDVKNLGKELVLKDFAYETKCEVGILAGDKIGDTTTVGITDLNTLKATVYSFDKTVYINLNEMTENLYVHIYDPTGKVIYSNQIKDQITHIKLNDPQGIYVVEVISGKRKYSKKVFIY